MHQIRDEKKGVASARHMRHTFRTVLAELGATPDQAKLLMGHALSGDVSTRYITSGLPALVESLRPAESHPAGDTDGSGRWIPLQRGAGFDFPKRPATPAKFRVGVNRQIISGQEVVASLAVHSFTSTR